MSNTVSAIAWVWGTVSGAAFGVGATMSTIQAPDIAGIPWEKIGATGAAGAVLLCVWFFLRFNADVRKENNEQLSKRDETIKTIAADFSSTATNIAKTFSETTATMQRETRSEASEREKRLQDLFQTMTRDKA